MEEERKNEPGMHSRRIEMQDGRYMILYTFDGALARTCSAEEEKPEPHAEQKSVEEENV